MEKQKKTVSFFLLDLYRGGGERAMIDIMRMFCERGYLVDLLLMKKEGAYLTLLDKRVCVIELKSRRILFTLPKIVQYLKNKNPEAIFSISKHTHIISLLAKVISKTHTKIILRIGVPFSFNLRKANNVREMAVPFLMRWLYTRADKIIAVSKGIKDDIEKTLHLNKDKTAVIYTPKYIKEIQERGKMGADGLWLDSSTPTILAIGRLSPQKDFSTLLQAFSLSLEKIQTYLVIVGSGEEEEPLRDLAKKLGIEGKVSFITAHSNPYPYLANATLFVSSSLFEGLPNVHVEALALGAPIISTDCMWGPREILAPETPYARRVSSSVEYGRYGILVPPRNIKLLAKAIIKILEDKDLLGVYKERGLKRAEDFDMSVLGDFYEALIK